jgi:hypothetical protein
MLRHLQATVTVPSLASVPIRTASFFGRTSDVVRALVAH